MLNFGVVAGQLAGGRARGSGLQRPGTGGQFIFVVPEVDLGVVFTGNNEGDDMFIPVQLMRQYVLPVMRE